jgi:hypothetical protein
VRGYSKFKVEDGLEQQLDGTRSVAVYPGTDEDGDSAYKIVIKNSLADDNALATAYHDSALALIQMIAQLYARKSGFKV